MCRRRGRAPQHAPRLPLPPSQQRQSMPFSSLAPVSFEKNLVSVGSLFPPAHDLNIYKPYRTVLNKSESLAQIF
ncbi:hypothetical protein CBM2585_A50025 [Cupriavidus taiwanensis]|nr:hypothetical protein CBM2585_A50025 [Cupriavidus taiwanensis]